MTFVHKLRNSVKRYDWGSPTYLPVLLGAPNPGGEPWAELWMGAHPGAPSTAETTDGDLPLDELFRSDPAALLGSASRFGALPYLFKLLAAARPLSVQAHPDAVQAKSGWERENAAGVPLDSPTRNYKDPNPKPEILCALSPFRAMCGFRPPAEIAAGLSRIASPALGPALAALADADAARALSGFLEALFSVPQPDRRSLADAAVLAARQAALRGDPAWGLVERFAALYPQDPAILSSLYLNVIDLEPRQAVFLPAGILHAYVEGFGAELMAASDNVLRGGLTSKFVDVGELSATLRFEPFRPDILEGVEVAPGRYRYPTPAEEFVLERIECRGGSVLLDAGSPSIAVVVEGSGLAEDGAGARVRLEKGESVLLDARAPGPSLSGSCVAFVASAPRKEVRR